MLGGRRRAGQGLTPEEGGRGPPPFCRPLRLLLRGPPGAGGGVSWAAGGPRPKGSRSPPEGPSRGGISGGGFPRRDGISEGRAPPTERSCVSSPVPSQPFFRVSLTGHLLPAAPTGVTLTQGHTTGADHLSGEGRAGLITCRPLPQEGVGRRHPQRGVSQDPRLLGTEQSARTGSVQPGRQSGVTAPTLWPRARPAPQHRVAPGVCDTRPITHLANDGDGWVIQGTPGDVT